MFDWLEGFFFVDDGWFGVDKVGHFFLHFGIAIVNFWTGATLLNTILTSEAIGILTEFFHAMHWKRIGFSLKDVLWNTLGMLTGILAWYLFFV